MSTEPNNANALPFTDRARIWWAVRRYDFWLDTFFARRGVRRDLRRELSANLTDAATTVGAKQAVANVGGLRRLAAQMTAPEEDRPRWYAGAMAGLAALAALWLLFLLQAFTYVEGVLDSEPAQEISSSLFPFVWSEVVVTPDTGDGFSFTLFPGPMPFVYAGLVWLWVARPWRALRSTPSLATVA